MKYDTTIVVPIETELKRQLQKTADAHQRTLSSMARVFIREGIVQSKRKVSDVRDSRPIEAR